ncbi:unnamed protein product [Owenia fusiformis]|uniref:Uncharacterized protein n=1 Tax=Owenia fusiformis TaxID=6347 RepID=A0A8J1U8U4_OWEFU|nr:unnamed protein product [Owenia fusiformis]
MIHEKGILRTVMTTAFFRSGKFKLLLLFIAVTLSVYFLDTNDELTASVQTYSIKEQNSIGGDEIKNGKKTIQDDENNIPLSHYEDNIQKENFIEDRNNILFVHDELKSDDDNDEAMKSVHQIKNDDIDDENDYDEDENNEDDNDEKSFYRSQHENDIKQTFKFKGILEKRLPKFIIIGVHKCGTMALATFLSIHPYMVRSRAHEVHYFDNFTRQAMGLNYYLNQMPYTYPSQIPFEKTPAYFDFGNIKAIYEMNKNIKLGVIACNPIKRVMSHHLNKLKAKERLNKQFNGTYESCVMNGDKLNTDCIYITRGLYIEHLTRYMEYFPRENFFIIKSEDLRYTPVAVLQKFEKFMNIPKFFNNDTLYYNNTMNQFCINKPYWKNPYMELNRGCFPEHKNRVHPQVREGIPELLLEYYKPYNEKFAEIAGLGKLDWGL